MVGFIIVSIIIIIILAVRFANRNTKEPIPRLKSTFDEFEKAGIFIRDDSRHNESAKSIKDVENDVVGESDILNSLPEYKLSASDVISKNDYFKRYYELYRELNYQELNTALNAGNKSYYADYTEEEKQRWRAIKVLMEQIENEEFRDYFIKKEFLKETDPGAIIFKMQQIDYKEKIHNMIPIPDDIKDEAKKYAEKLEEMQLIAKLKTKTILQLENYMHKRGLSSFSDQLQNYYHFRQHFLFKENRIKNDIKRIKDKSIRAANEEIIRATREDMHRMQEDLMWIMEGFFELSEEEQKSIPEKDFFKSEFI